MPSSPTPDPTPDNRSATATTTVVKSTSSATQKASLLLFPDIDVRGDVPTIVRLQNDATQGVMVKCYFMDGEKRRNDVSFLLTKGQPVWFDAFTGAGTLGANSFPAGFGAGLLACFAVNADETAPIRWNHLSGTATVVNYAAGTAYEYSAWLFYAVQGTKDGAIISPPPLFTMPAPYELWFKQILFEIDSIGINHEQTGE